MVPVPQDPEPAGRVAATWPPQRLVRTVLGSIADSKDFGKQMARGAKRRRFPEARDRAFLGDGLPWNWSIRKRHFPDFTAILDFIHVLSFLFLAAKAVHALAADAWDQYLVWMRGVWQGEVAQVLVELHAWQTRLGKPPEGVPDQDPRKVLAKTITFLKNNRDRMNYPAYRQAGLPVTTAWMESLGLRIYNVVCRKHFAQEAIIPTTAESLGLETVVGCLLLLQQADRQLPEQSQVLAAVARMVTAVVLTEHDIQHPVQRVLDAPVAPDRTQVLIRRPHKTADLIRA